MAAITLEVAPNQIERVYEAFAQAYGYHAEISDPDNPGEAISNPVTVEEFGKARIADFIRNTVASVEGERASSEARTAAIQSVTDEVVIS